MNIMNIMMSVLMSMCFVLVSVFASEDVLLKKGSEKIVTKEVFIKSYEFNKKKQLYRLNIRDHAGAYYAPHKLLSCLDFSIKKEKSIKISFGTRSLRLSNCEILPTK